MAEWQTREFQKLVRVIPHEGSTPFLGTLPLTEKMGKEAKVTLKDFKELALFTIEDSVSAYYRAKKRGFFSEEEGELLDRAVEVALAIAKAAKVDGFGITTAVLSKTPTQIRRRTLSEMANVYELSDDNVDYLELIFEIR